jgi:regulatory protein
MEPGWVKITNIKQQLKRHDRYSIFIDGKYSFTLSESELLTKAIRVGQELSNRELDKLKDSAVIDKGIYRVMELISRRPRSRWEIEDYLKRKKYEPQETEQIISALDKKGYIDDLDFAKRWVDNRRLLKPISKRKLILELRQKRVSDETIQAVLEEDETDETDVLSELIEKKRRQTKYQDKQKLIGFLSRQGFNYGDIKEALEDSKTKSQ